MRLESTIPEMIIRRSTIPSRRSFCGLSRLWRSCGSSGNKTTFGKNLFAVGGNAEAAAVSGISVFGVTVGAFILAGILYGFGSWLECIRMFGSGSAAYGQGWEMDAIAACVVGGISFTGEHRQDFRRCGRCVYLHRPDLFFDDAGHRHQSAVCIFLVSSFWWRLCLTASSMSRKNKLSPPHQAKRLPARAFCSGGKPFLLIFCFPH